MSETPSIIGFFSFKGDTIGSGILLEENEGLLSVLVSFSDAQTSALRKD